MRDSSELISKHNPKALKHLFSKELLRRISKAIVQEYSLFNHKKFLMLFKVLERLEMKPRVQCIREELKRQLPDDYGTALQILISSSQRGALKGFDLWPFSDFVQTYGLEYLEISLDALKKWTPIFSSEFAIRPYLKTYPHQTLSYLETCARDKSVDLRRWASEGTRPRLPWGERLNQFVEDPALTFPILELLKFDSELYVRKSVSNHLNDIAKDHPQQVIDLLKGWKRLAGAEDFDKVEWIIRRALRTLIKLGHPGALELIGVSSDAEFKVTDLTLNQKTFRLGDRMAFSFKIRSISGKRQNFLVDYIIHFLKSNQDKSPKVFKLKSGVLPANGEIVISKNHHLKRVTTRTYYPGVHLLSIQVNGRSLANVSWNLI